MSNHHHSDDERQSLLRQVILQCQLEHLERCWNLDQDGNSLLDDEAEGELDDLDELDDFDEFDDEDFEFPDFGLFDESLLIPLNAETEDWIEDIMFRSLIDP